VPENAGENTIRTAMRGSVPYTVQRAPRAVKPGRNSAYSRTGGRTEAAAAKESESRTCGLRSWVYVAAQTATAPVRTTARRARRISRRAARPERTAVRAPRRA